MNLKKDIIIAIDGHASCGKSTLAKLLAQEIKYTYIDTGAMYRAVALYAIQNNFINNGNLLVTELVKNLDKITIDFKFDNDLNKSVTYLNSVNVEDKIRTIQVSQYASPVATISEVRRKLVALQQEMGKSKKIVIDGRDISTVVFPDADLKIFLTASPKVRAQRRFLEMTEKGEEVTFDEVLQNIQERDHRDSTRDDSPLLQADDAILIDNSNLNKTETYKVALTIVAEKFGSGIAVL